MMLVGTKKGFLKIQRLRGEGEIAKICADEVTGEVLDLYICVYVCVHLF